MVFKTLLNFISQESNELNFQSNLTKFKQFIINKSIEEENLSYHVSGHNVTASISDEGDITIVFYDNLDKVDIFGVNNFSVTYSTKIGTLVTCLNESDELICLEIDVLNKKHIFNEYIELFFKYWPQ